MEGREDMKSFISEPILQIAHAAAIEIGEKTDQLVKLDLPFGEENPMYISDKEEKLKVVLATIHDDEGRPFFIGHTKE
jgi:hypothetical protein